jgi:general secretion pathway protein D
MRIRSRALRSALAFFVVGGLSLAAGGCGAGRSSYRAGNKEAQQGNWDVAVARYTKAVSENPDEIGYQIALQNARFQASREHLRLGRQLLAELKLEEAINELDIAVKYDIGNQVAVDERTLAQERLARLNAEQDDRAGYEERRGRALAAQVPLPVLSPRSQSPITLEFKDQSLEKIFEALSKLSGVNIMLDQDFRDSPVSVQLSGVSFEEALEQITFVNKLFFKVLNQNTVIIVPNTAQKVRTYDEALVQTFYLQNADVAEMVALLTKLTGIQKIAGNEKLGAITVIGTPDELALSERIVDANDKARGEVMVEVKILEVNRSRMKEYGIRLSNYGAGVSFQPTGSEGEVDESGFTNLRAHMLASLNLSDFVVSIPSALFATLEQTESIVKILAAPTLRAAVGEQTSLNIGTEVPIPVTTFTSAAPGALGGLAPATSFQYRTVGVTLELTPNVYTNGEISLQIVAEFSLLGEDRVVGTLTVPTFLTRRVTGTLRLRDGETSLLGGLTQEREAENASGAMGLQDIPFLGGLFRTKNRQKDNQEVVISITPHVVRSPLVTEDDMRTLYVGTKERVRVPGARPPLFGEETEEDRAQEASRSPGSTGGSVGIPEDEEDSADVEEDGTPPGDEEREGERPPGVEREEPPPYPEPPSPESGAPSATRSLFRPSEVSVGVGETRDLELVVLSAGEFVEAELVLTYEGVVVEADTVSAGPLLTLSGEPVGVESEQRSGYVLTRFRLESEEGGSGVLATIKLRGLAEGSGSIEAELTLIDHDGERLAVPGAAGRVVVAVP